MGLTPEALAAWVTASCQAQGVPVKVTDPGTVDRVRVLLSGVPTESHAHARSARGDSVGERHRRQRGSTLAGSSVRAPSARLDGRVVENSAHDGSLPVEVQVAH